MGFIHLYIQPNKTTLGIMFKEFLQENTVYKRKNKSVKSGTTPLAYAP